MKIRHTKMLTVITGCMFSGKSTELIRRVNCLRSIGENVLVINHASDNRYTDSEAVVSHSGRTMTSLKAKRLTGIGHLGYGVIAIDEAQFFPDLVNAVLGFIENGKKVIVAGLIGDFQCNPIGDILELLPHADDTIRLYALCSVCRDGTRAAFTKRTTDSKEQVVIGSSIYMAVCRKCR